MKDIFFMYEFVGAFIGAFIMCAATQFAQDYADKTGMSLHKALGIVRVGIFTIFCVILCVCMITWKINNKVEDENRPYINTSHNFIVMPIGGAVEVYAKVENMEDITSSKWAWKADVKHVVEILNPTTNKVIIKAVKKGDTYISVSNEKNNLCKKIFVSCMTEKEYKRLRADMKCKLLYESNPESEEQTEQVKNLKVEK